MTETTELTLQELKRVNEKLKEELEKAKLEKENDDLRKEINRLRNRESIYIPDYTYNPKPWDNMILCDNK